MPRRPSGSKPTPIRSPTSTRIPLYHHGNLIIHCRSTWTRTNPRARHLLRTLAHMKDEHPCRGPGLRSWLLQRVPGQSTKEAFLHDRRRGYGGGKLTTQACMADARSELDVACAASISAAHPGTSPHTPRPTTPRNCSDTSWSHARRDCLPHTRRGNRPRPQGPRSCACGIRRTGRFSWRLHDIPSNKVRRPQDGPRTIPWRVASQTDPLQPCHSCSAACSPGYFSAHSSTDETSQWQ